jgi:hypothetical protein
MVEIFEFEFVFEFELSSLEKIKGNALEIPGKKKNLIQPNRPSSAKSRASTPAPP